MTGGSRSYALDISEHLFHLTTESLRLHSNETRRYQSLASLINQRLQAAPALEEREAETIRQHLSAIPTKGDIRVYLSITKSGANNLTEVKRRLGETLGSDVTVGDTLSVMLFHYVVDQKAARVLERLGLCDSEDSPNPAHDSDNTARETAKPR